MDLQRINNAKEYMKSYGKLLRKTERIKLELEEMRRISDKSALLQQKEYQYEELKEQLTGKYIEITNQIEQILNENEKDVLIYRYIKLLKWEEIAAKMHFCCQYTHKIHAQALEKITRD